MSKTKYEYDPHYLREVIEYGRMIGAERVVMMNGSCYQYYKKGNKDSKYCELVLNPDNVRLLKWQNSYNTCLEQGIAFYQGLGWQVEVIDVWAFELPEIN